MSGVYIPNMEMPTACLACPCCYDNACSVTNMLPTYEEWYESKPSWCPLIPVPDHGDLIDRDALMKRKVNCYDEQGHLLYAVTGDIMRMPTIIPADKDGE